MSKRNLALRQPEYRALQVYSDVPSGCELHLIKDGCHAPHLRVGEFAVVDTEDREIVYGELFLVQQTRNQQVWQVRRGDENPIYSHDPERPTAWLRPLNGPRSMEDVEERWRRGQPVYTSDGPIYLDCLTELIIGRVIGIYQA